MQLSTKKIIAREFLVLMLCLGISIITFLLKYTYNFYIQKKVENIEKEILRKSFQSDSLWKLGYKKTENQIWYTHAFISKFNKGLDYTNIKLWKRLYELVKRDSIKYKWENSWNKDLITFNRNLGFETPEKFQAFILSNIVYPRDKKIIDSAKHVDWEISELRIQLNRVSKEFLSTKDQLQGAFLVFTLAVIILFVFRYTFYGLRWSIKILKED